ncbi:MAG: hypothetical protein ACLSAF_04685 [Intestinimonas sp.]
MGRRLLELGIGEIWTGHCTGTPAFELLRPCWGSGSTRSPQARW